jgi:hypothetical protein
MFWHNSKEVDMVKKRNNDSVLFRNRVADTLYMKGFNEIEPELMCKKIKKSFVNDAIFSHKVKVGVSMFGEPLKADLAFFRGKDKYAIFTRWQGCGGSAEHKLPYLVRSIETGVVIPSIIITGGTGFSMGALEWLNSYINNRQIYKTSRIDVLTEDIFVNWCNNFYTKEDANA